MIIVRNSLKYTGPTGEIVWFVPIFIGAAVGLINNSFEERPFFEGARTGALRGGVGQLNRFMSSVNIPITDNFSISASMGIGFDTSGFAADFNVAKNYTNGDFSASLSYGAGESGGSSYSGYVGSVRIGDYGAGYNRTSYSGAHSQVVGGVSLSYKNVSFRLENDFFGDRHDRWRSNAFELSVGNFVFGSNLYNNDVWDGYSSENPPPTDDTGMLLNNSCNRSGNSAWKDGPTYSSPLWVGYNANGSVHRFGFSHPLVQDRTQNWIHKWFPPGQTNFFNKYDSFHRGGYNYIGYNNPYSLW